MASMKSRDLKAVRFIFEASALRLHDSGRLGSKGEAGQSDTPTNLQDCDDQGGPRTKRIEMDLALKASGRVGLFPIRY